MIRIDEHYCQAPPEVAIKVGASVERWPEILPHYRWVRFHEQRGFAEGVVEMAAWRPFGLFKYPTWWKSEMWYDADGPTVHYRHIKGITRGMDVRWEFHAMGTGTHIRIIHEWAGPPWPLIRRPAASWVIGPIFVSAIAQRTLAGVCAEAERVARG